ncbi:MAG: hypothetical protein RLO51_03145 [Thalassobaculum sp.]
MSQDNPGTGARATRAIERGTALRSRPPLPHGRVDARRRGIALAAA